MAERLWLYIEGDLDVILGPDFVWKNIGFDSFEIRNLNLIGYQLPNDSGVLITLYPISNPGLFWSTVGPSVKNNPKSAVITQEDAEKIHSKLLLKHQEEIIKDITTPSKEEVFNATMLLTVMEIKNALIKEE